VFDRTSVQRIELSAADLERKTDLSRTNLEKKIEVTNERTKAELVRWVFVVMLGNVALSTGATAILNVLQHPH
jgi:hypothetical protein